MQDLASLVIHSAKNGAVRLHEIAAIKEVAVQSEIVRENQQYQRWVTFEYRGPYRFGKKVVERVVAATKLPPGYALEIPTWDFGEDDQRQIVFIGLLAVLLVFMVTAALYESLIQPFIIMLSVPLALIGVFLIYWLTETNFDRSAHIGVVLLSGIVVNNAILLVDRISRLKNKGMPISEAIITGAEQRLRPIIMTTSTTVLGLLPLVIYGDESQL